MLCSRLNRRNLPKRGSRIAGPNSPLGIFWHLLAFEEAGARQAQEAEAPGGARFEVLFSCRDCKEELAGQAMQFSLDEERMLKAPLTESGRPSQG